MHEIAEKLSDNLNAVIKGTPEAIEHVIVALFSGGNILLEDVPGVGKTTLAKALARSLNVKFNRIQFTPDLLPSDILGGSIFHPQTGEFVFREGAIFCNVLLADEINRASPRTQSALLEAMTEGQVTIEGKTRTLAQPFLVVATQNPIEFHGTYSLPEAQLDRFLLQLEIGYPDTDTECDILYGQQREHPLDSVTAVTDAETLIEIQRQVREIGVEDTIGNYIVRCTQITRGDDRLRLGASPRASLMLFRAVQARALIYGRRYAIPDDVKALAVPILAHRLVLDTKAKYSGASKDRIVQELLDTVPVPK
jgi:MoxR-like ATPase